MVRADEYLRFRPEDIEWEDDSRPRQPGPTQLTDVLGMFWSAVGWSLLGFVVLSVALVVINFITFDPKRESRQNVQTSSSPPTQNRQAPPNTRYPNYPASGSSTTQASAFPADAKPTATLNLTYNGQVHYLEFYILPQGVWTRGPKPAELALGHFTTEIYAYDQLGPNGRHVAIAHTGTHVLYSRRVYAWPCWRWFISVDGMLQGYGCFTPAGQ